MLYRVDEFVEVFRWVIEIVVEEKVDFIFIVGDFFYFSRFSFEMLK